MKNMKGFTLVELLAVIVILAIVALITAPIILNAINESREGAAKDSAWGAIEASKLTYAQAQTIDGYSTTAAITLTFPNNAKFVTGTKERVVSVSGDKPKSGTITIGTDGVVTCKDLEFSNSYYCTTDTTGNKMCCSKQQDQTCS